MALKKFEKEYFVHVYETGPDGNVNLYSLFNFMQDIASEHAIRLGFGREDLMKKNQFWVLSRIYAEIYTWPAWEDIFVVKTWPTGTDKMFAMRNYEICYPDGRVIASSVSSWLIVDRTTRRIQRPDQVLTQYNSENQSDVLVRSSVKLSPSNETGGLSHAFNVRLSDLDINLHTNNANYMKWVTDTYDLNFITNHQACSAEINYLAESMFNDEIVIRTSPDQADNNFYNHSVIRKNDEKELCRIRIQWKERITNPCK
jgi:medium-chain acyl-[acyl-carrier-protein] hydrolase